MMVASHFISQGYETRQILGLLQIPSSSWYYQSTGGRQGPRPSTHTRALDGRLLPNQEIVRRIEELLQQDFVDYGRFAVAIYQGDPLAAPEPERDHQFQEGLPAHEGEQTALQTAP